MKRLAAWIMRFRHHLLVGIVLPTIFFGYQLTKLKIDSDILNYLPQDDPVVVLFREIGDKFGGNSLAMVALETDDVFNQHTLSRIDSITTRFQDLPEISQVLSLTDILDIKKIPDGIEVGKLIPRGRVPEDRRELRELREYCLSKDMYRGSLVSADGRIALIIARVREGTSKTEVACKMKDIVKSTEGKEKIYYAGIPFQMVFLTDIITKDLMRLIPLVSLLVVLVLYFSFHSVRGVLLPLGTVLISTIWIIGLMSSLGIDLTIVTASIPILLIAIGSAYGIHLLSAHLEGRERYDSKIYHIQQTLKNIALPIILTGITTLVGFLSFLFSYLTMTQQFGVFASLGVFFAMALSIVFIPVVLSYLPAKMKVKSKEDMEEDLSTKFMSLIANLVLSHERLIITGGVLIIITALIAIPRLHREVNMVEYFKHDTEIRQAEDMMEKSFGGAIPVQILVSGDIKDPLVLRAMFKFEKYLRSLPDINDPQSVADLIAELNEQMNGRHTIPDTREGVANLWFFIEGNKVMDQLVADNDTRALIQAKIGTVNSSKVIAVVDSIDRHLEKDVPRGLFRLELASLPESIQHEVREQRIAEVARMISLDAGYYGAGQMNPNRILSVIKTVDSPEVRRLNHLQSDALSQAIKTYFQSDAADLPVDSDLIIRGVIAGLEPVFLTSSPDEASILSVLQQQIPESIYEDDPEALEYAAFALRDLITDGRRQAIVDGLTGKILEITPDMTETVLSAFRRDIQGDIWTLLDDYVGLPSDQITSVVASEIHSNDLVKLSTLQTGMPIIFRKLDRSVLRSQALSLIVAMTLVFLLLAFRFRSFTGGLISLAPITGTILCNFILMSILGIPLDVVSILIGSVAVGIGIDYTIHFLTRFQKEFQTGKSEQEALRETLQTTGKAIIINAASVMMGFLVLMLGNIVPMQRFGYLTAITMVTSALGAITVLPALILVTRARFIGEFDRVAEGIRQQINGLKNFASRKL
ncbi:hypothetical protein DRH29_03960 [candidate division Kazan bacterium]|uniref:SSD domain-containing protein n=1 Tax=candidate division Kazan bacterium TaxID=2202143 RepID=A0A420ZBZ3_UNCK3|nr:MAG: hypothetical protein DRH29_03960 [candidate division Kazan bacterium]